MSNLSLHSPHVASPLAASLDPIAELKLRRWAREHHVPAAERDPLWHPVVWQEMAARDRERAALAEVEARSLRRAA
ncbi:hypothetical protein [Alienimonas californiensis]|uniref:Uncharacterized protein n=1 Tax=Alienimonas californiensis TaxID=2527989 RepID=A0A517P941_9PLAN|nr:hypothetical protein [Alienimonas californiensis]QDT15893.1 hypothetical protein CA12_19900 [Alienimonas californiensis]